MRDTQTETNITGRQEWVGASARISIFILITNIPSRGCCTISVDTNESTKNMSHEQDILIVVGAGLSCGLMPLTSSLRSYFNR